MSSQWVWVRNRVVEGVDDYEEKDFIDAKDNQGDWRVGYVVTKYPTSFSFKVRFDGWDDKYDEVFKFSSSKLLPFRAKVIGYTGQKSYSAHRISWKFDLNAHHIRLLQMRQFCSSLQERTVFNINQTIRGHNYHYVDFLTASTFNSLTAFEAALEYFSFNLELLITFIKAINANFEENFLVWQTGFGEEGSKVAESSMQAYRCSYFEVFDTLSIISGNYPRQQSFFKDNEQWLQKQFPDSPPNELKRSYQLHIVQMFNKQQGFLQINTLLQKLLNAELSIPFLFLYSFANIVQCTSRYTVVRSREHYALKLLQIAKKSISLLKDSHFKDFHLKHLTDFLGSLTAIAERTNIQNEVQQFVVQAQLGACLRMITCPYFEKKLKGISSVMTVSQKRTIIIQDGRLRAWVIDSKLIKCLFVNNDNPQLIKKAAGLVRFLHTKHQLTEQMLETIWGSRASKHETALKEVYNLLADYPQNEESMDHKIALFEKISQVPAQQQTEDYIGMLRSYTRSALMHPNRQFHVFGHDIIYKYYLAHPRTTSLDFLIQVTKCFQHTPLFASFQVQCFDKVKKRQQPDLHINILLRLLNDTFARTMIYEQHSNEILLDYLVGDRPCSDQKLDNVFTLLANVLKKTQTALLLEEFLSLWTKFSHCPASSQFMQWIYRRKDNGKVSLSSFVHSRFRKQLLQELWSYSSVVFEQMHGQELTFFIELFKTVNVSEDKMVRKHPIMFTINSLDLRGYEKLWLILKHARDAAVVNGIIQFIAQLHLSQENELEKGSVVTGLVQRIQKNIREAMEEKVLVQKAESQQQSQMCRTQKNVQILRLLETTRRVILWDQQVYPSVQTVKMSYFRDYTVKRVEEENVIRFNSYRSLYEFKKLVSQKWSLPMHTFELYHAGEVIPKSNYFSSMLQNKFGVLNIVVKSEIYSELKQALNHKLELFFELLGEPSIERQVWAIVSKLPISQDIKTHVQASIDTFLGELQGESIYRQLYIFRVVLELGSEHWHIFTTKQNLLRLLAKLTQLHFVSDIEREYFDVVIEIIGRMFAVYPSLAQVFGQRLFQETFLRLQLLLNKVLEGLMSSTTLQCHIITNVFGLGAEIGKHLSLPEYFLGREQCVPFFNLSLVLTNDKSLRKQLLVCLKQLFKHCPEAAQSELMHVLLKKIFPLAHSRKHSVDLSEYFNFLASVLHNANSSLLQQYFCVQQKLILEVFMLAKEQPAEDNYEKHNVCLVGYLSLLTVIVKYCSREVRQNLIDFLLQDCLFGNGNVKCKSKLSRSEAFEVLKGGLVGSSISTVTRFLRDLHHRGEWRSRRIDDWTISPKDKLKSATGFVGLVNLGCICYMNSLLQQLYMIPTFRTGILACKDPARDLNSQEDLLFQLQRMFLHLQLSDCRSYNPKDFCLAFKDDEEKSVNVSEQMDIDEFSGMLFDRLQRKIKTLGSDLVKGTFGGVFSNEIVCRGCPHFSQTEESFLSVGLTVKSKKTILQSFQTMVQGDNLDGDNAYFCERCNKKVAAVKRVCLKELPDHLLITLKRFQFDYESMTKLKVNDYCEFPFALDLQHFSHEYLRRMEKGYIGQDAQQRSQCYYQYELKGIVVHSGYADSGHYYSLVQDRLGDKWFQFNDSIVRDYNRDNLADQTYGSKGYQSNEKISNAYMLLYQRSKMSQQSSIGLTITQNCAAHKSSQVNELLEVNDLQINTQIQSSITENQQALPSNKDFPNGVQNPLSMYGQVLKEISNLNRQQKLQNIMFSREYSKFIVDLLEQLPQEGRNELLQLAITSYLTVSLRDKSDLAMYSQLRKIQPHLEVSPELTAWVLGLFSCGPAFDEFFLHNPLRDVRLLVAFWLSSLYPLSERMCQILFCNQLLNKITEQGENLPEVCQMLDEITAKDESTLDYLVEKSIVGRLMENSLRREERKFVEVLPCLRSDESIGCEILLQPSKKSDKPRQYHNENASVWALYYRVLKRAQSKGITLSKYTSKREKNYLNMRNDYVYRVLQNARDRLEIDCVVRVLCEAAKDNVGFSKMLLEIIEKGLKDLQAKWYRQFMLLFEGLLRIEDGLIQLRLGGLQYVFRALQHNNQYSLDSNVIQQWIIILLNRNSCLREYLLTQRVMLDSLTVLPPTKIPTKDIWRKHAVFTDSMLSKLHGVHFPKYKRGYLRLVHEMEEFYARFEDDWVESSVWPVQGELDRSSIAEGDVLSYFDAKEIIDYEQVRVRQVFMGRVKLEGKQGKIINVWKTDEKLSVYMHSLGDLYDSDRDSSQTTQMNIEDDDFEYQCL